MEKIWLQNVIILWTVISNGGDTFKNVVVNRKPVVGEDNALRAMCVFALHYLLSA